MTVIKQRLVRRLASSVAIALVTALAPVVAEAQSTTPDRIDAIEQHIRQLESELQVLKRDLGATRQQLRQSQRETAQARAEAEQTARSAGQPRSPIVATAPPPRAGQPPAAAGPREPEIIIGREPPGLPEAPAAGVHVLETGPARFGIESADGRNAIFLTGRLHYDIGDYLDYKPGSKFAAVQDLNSGVNARRARLGIVGRFMHDWDYTFIYDFGGSSDGYPPLTGALPSGIENALLTYNGLKNRGVPVVFDIGYMDVPFSLEESNSSNDVPFVERASIINVATNIFANDFRSALGARSYDDHYWAGLYLTGPTSGTSHTTGEQIGIAAAYLGGIWDSSLNVLTDVLLVIPLFPLLIIIAAYAHGGTTLVLIAAITLTSWSYTARQLRSQALTLRNRDFLEAARVRGERKLYIIVVEVIPTMTSLIVASFLTNALYAVLFASSLQFIGLGDPNTVSWGTTLYWAENNAALQTGEPLWAIAPGFCIALLGAAFALLNYAFDEIGNPALRPVRRSKGVRSA